MKKKIIQSLILASVFFVTYNLFDIFYAIFALIILSILNCKLMSSISIKWKPTLDCIAFASILLFSQFFLKKIPIKALFSSKIVVSEFIWAILNIMWIIFFIFIGILNVYVIYNYSTKVWVNFKVFGIMGATAVFAAIQVFFIAGFAKNTKLDSSNKIK